MAAILDERWSATWVEARAEVTLPSARRAHRRTEPRALNAAAPASAPADVTVHDAPASNHQPKAASEARIHEVRLLGAFRVPKRPTAVV